MNSQVKAFYQNTQDKEIIALHENQDIAFDKLKSMAPQLPRGWFELVHLTPIDRIEFIAAFWSSIFPYSPYVQDLINQFFSCVEDIGVYLVKKDLESLFFPHLVYSMEGEDTFYRGFPSAAKEDIHSLRHAVQHLFPEDYICFMKIHNGFARNGDYGLLSLDRIPREKQLLESKINTCGQKITFQGKSLDPEYLIPFYKSYGDCVYQCFHKGWYPDKEMGNILFSLSDEVGFEYTLRVASGVFPSFLDWLMFYMDVRDV